MNKRKFELKPEKIPVQKNLSNQRKFSYRKGATTLDFTLGLDGNELMDFKECLEEAIKDIDEIQREGKN